MRSCLRLALAVAAAALPAVAGAADASAPDEQDKWFNAAPDNGASGINEGQLVFLPVPPQKPVHHHHNSFVIDDAALADGWARLVQCHQNLDRVPAAQILFSHERTRDLAIFYQHGIGRAWVQGSSVQLQDIGGDAWLCLSARSRALHDNHDGTWTLKNGPFMRRFLDGYYPMHVSMKVLFETTRIRFERAKPEAQQGFRVWESAGEVNVDAWFEGKLSTELRFSAAGAPR
jgi:hypothetical protein